MSSNCNFKPVKLIVLLTFSIIFGVASNGLAGGPQPGPKEENGPELVGKSVGGFLSVVVVDREAIGADFVLAEEVSEIVVQHIVVTCKAADVVLGPAINFPSPGKASFDLTMEECFSEGDLCVEDLVFPTALTQNPALRDCFPWDDAAYTDLFITRVSNFVKTELSISADVTLRLGRKP